MAAALVEVFNSGGIAALIGVVGGVSGALIGRGQSRKVRERQERREDIAAWRAERATAFTALMSKLDRAMRAATKAYSVQRHPGTYHDGQYSEQSFKEAWKLCEEYEAEVDAIVILGADGVHKAAIEASICLVNYLIDAQKPTNLNPDMALSWTKLAESQEILMDGVKASLGLD